MSALNLDRASRQRDIAVGAAVFEGPAVTLASNAGAPAAAPLASNLLQAAACAPAALCGDRRVRTATGLKLGSGVGWRCAYQHFRGAGREPREENFGATLLHLIR